MTTANRVPENLPENWLQLLAEHSDHIYSVTSLDPPRTLYVSAAFEKIWKMPVSSILGDPNAWLETIVEEDRSRVASFFESLIAGSVDRFDLHYRIVDGHGAVRWIRGSGSVVPSPHGDGRLILGVVEDSTDLHRSEHTLRERIEWFNLLIEQSPVILWTTDRKLRYTSAAGLGLTTLGVRQNENVGKSIFEYFQTQDHEYLPIKMHFRALQGEECEHDFEWMGRSFKNLLRPFRNSQGEITGVIGAAFDVTELIRAEAALLESVETHRTLIEYNPELVALVVDGKLAYVNEALQRVTGYTPQEMIGRSPVEFVIPEDRQRAGERIRAVMSGDTPSPSEYRTMRKDGVLRNIEVLAQRISYRGRPALVAFIHDITARKEVEDQIRAHGVELERLVEERTTQIRELERQRAESEKLAATGRMAARVAHEINNPLAGIKSAFHLIRDSIPTDHPQRHYVELIDREIERIKNIVQLMYRLYRPGATQWQLVSIENCVRDVVALIALTAEKRGIKILTGDLECPRIRMPMGYMEQILFNLIQNAMDATREGGIVDVSSGPSPLGVAISVSDRGPGIPEELRAKIFEPFFSTKTAEEPAGLGLGLSVTRSLAESVGGFVEYSDRPGGGATFTVMIPLQK